jgi:hypothetical protein
MPLRKKLLPPRMGPVAIATILTLREQGRKLEEIAAAPYVKKQDGSRPSQQAVAYVPKTNKLKKARGSWGIRSATGKGGGRPRKMTPERKKKVINLLEKHRFNRVRAPWVLRKLKFPVKLRTVQRAINEAGYFLPALTNKRVLGWLKAGSLTGKRFAALAKANFATWCEGKDALILDGTGKKACTARRPRLPSRR